MEKYFNLLVPRGAVVHSKEISRVLDNVPEDAFDLWEKGASYLSLKKEATEVLQSWEKSRLQRVLSLKETQGMKSDVFILEQVIKQLSKTSSKPKQEK